MLSTTISIKNGMDVPADMFRTAVAQIHASINWSHYNHSIHQRETLVALLDEKIVGYVSTHFNTTFALISYIAVDMAYQDRKIGKVLMTGVVDKCRTIGINTLQLHFRGNNEKTKAFYENFAQREGLKYDAQPSGKYMNGDPRVHVTMTLPETQPKTDTN